MRKRLLNAVLLVALFAVGFASTCLIFAALGQLYPKPYPVADSPSVIVESLIDLPPEIELMWQHEVERRFDNAVVLIVHGGDFVQGQWIVGSSRVPWEHVDDTKKVVQEYLDLYPGRTLVLVSCNPGHLKLGIPGVYYFTSNVWVIPDRNVLDDSIFGVLKHLDFSGHLTALGGNRWSDSPDTVGNIFEAVCD